jgi:hypothetical protein
MSASNCRSLRYTVSDSQELRWLRPVKETRLKRRKDYKVMLSDLLNLMYLSCTCVVLHVVSWEKKFLIW